MAVEVDRDIRAEKLARAFHQHRCDLGGRNPERVDDRHLLRARLDRRRVRGLEERQVGPGAVDAEVGDANALARGERDCVADPSEHGLARNSERLQLEVGDRALDHARLDAELDQGLDVRPDRPREAPDLGVEHRTRDQPHRLVVVLADAWEAGLDPLDAGVREASGDLELLVGIEHDADRLLPVAERRVVEADLRLESVRPV